MNLSRILILFTIFYFLFSASATFGAEIFLETKTKTVSPESKFEVSIILGTEETVNAIEGALVVPEGLEVEEIRDGNSIISFWIERPIYTAGKVVFSGVIPGGFRGRGQVFSVVLEPTAVGKKEFGLRDLRAYLHDGKGTETPVRSQPLLLDVTKNSESSGVAEIIDNEPPEDFLPLVAEDPAIFGGKKFLVFATQDKGSGIDYYQVLESKRGLGKDGDWITATSPYMLEDQARQSYIYVRAVDRHGNERVVRLDPVYKSWYTSESVWGILIVLMALAIAAWILKKKLVF